MNTVKDILSKSNNGLGVMGREIKPERKSKRQYHVTPLEQFAYGHLSAAEAKRLKAAVASVQRWITEAPAEGGLSLVLSGGFGTGKTTVAENAMKAFKKPMNAVYYDGYFQNIANALENQDMPNETRQTLESILATASPVQSVGEVMQGSLRTAAKTMVIAKEGDFSSEYGRDKVVVIDDIGTEGDLDYVSKEKQVHERWVRYGNLIDYCYREGKHVIITSNVPLYSYDPVEKESFFNDAFIDIVGGKAFDRLVQMADGYMIDLTGLPSYRPEVSGR
jgi:DNA replication protein DnaC